MKKIPLTQNKFALVDDEDYQYISQFKWSTHKTQNIWYAWRSCGLNPSIQMANDILPPSPGHKNHHKNRNGLDNQKNNLVPVTNKEHRKYHSEDIKKGVKLSKKPRWNAYKEFKKWQAKKLKYQDLFFIEHTGLQF